MKKKLIYVLAASHSGSTLTSMLLGAHPELCCVGELKATNLGSTNYLCSCGIEICECKFWHAIEQRMKVQNEEFDILDFGTNLLTGASGTQQKLLKPLVRSKFLEQMRDFALSATGSWKTHLSNHQRRNNRLIKAILDETGTKAIIDSSKIGIRLKYLLRDPELDVKIIWLVRDGRGVASAYANPSELADAKETHLRGGGTGKTQEESREVSQGAHEWKRCNEEALFLVEGLSSDRWIQIRYEDICSDTTNTLTHIFDFIGVDPVKSILDFKNTDHHVVGNGMRLDKTSTIKLDDRWRSALTEQQLNQFSVIAGEMNTKFGYL